MSEKKRHHRHYHLGGWVSPLCPMQFSVSPQADSGVPADAPADAGAGVSGDAGGTAP